MRLDNEWEKEISCDPSLLEEMNSNEKGLWFESEEEMLKRWRREDKKGRVLAKVMKVIDKLTPKQREALQLHYFGKKTYRQMEEIMGVSFQRCSILVSDAIKNVKKACAKARISL